MGGAYGSAWRVVWTREAMRSLSGVPARIVPAVFSFVDERLGVDPVRCTHALHDPLAAYRSGSVGSYRVLARVDDGVVYVMRVAYHADVYRPR